MEEAFERKEGPRILYLPETRPEGKVNTTLHSALHVRGRREPSMEDINMDPDKESRSVGDLMLNLTES